MAHVAGAFRWSLAALLLLAACDGSPTGPQARLPAVVQLQVGGSAVVASTTLQVRFADVEGDSRCPTTVVCVWEGEAVVRVELRDGGRLLGAPALSTHPSSGTHPNAARVDRYTLRLVALDPYPSGVAPIPRTDYRLTLEIA